MGVFLCSALSRLNADAHCSTSVECGYTGML